MMDEFEEIATGLVSEAFNDLTKIVDAMTDAEMQAYAERNPIRIWMVAGPSEEHSIAISAN